MVRMLTLGHWLYNWCGQSAREHGTRHGTPA